MTADSSFTEGVSHSGGALDLSAPQAVQESLRQLYDTLDHLSVANTAMRLFVSELDRRLLYQEAVETLTTLLDLRLCALFLYDEERNEVTLCAAWGIVPDVLARLRTRAIDLAAPDLVAHCLRERRTVRAVSSTDDAPATSLFGLPIQGVGMLVA
jgi:GAF domain-containing protein